MFRKYIHLFAALLAMIVIAGQSHAELLDDTLDFPKISFDSQGTTDYEASGQMLSISASPLAIKLSANEVTLIIGDCPSFSANVQVDNSGALVGGVPKDDLAVIGTVDLGSQGSFSGVLLTGEVTAFGSYNSDGTTDLFDFRFKVSGGDLSFLYQGKDIGVKVTSEGSSFGGSFNEDFGGEAKGTLGAVAPACSLMVTKTCFVPSPPSGVFECDEPINVLTMIWDGTEAVRIKAWKGAVGSTLLADVDNIAVGDEVTVSGFAGSPNDVIWEVFEAGTSVKIGESTFHLSCSDNDMNGLEDCGKRQGDGKDKSGYIDDWLLEGMVDAKNSFDCTVDPISPGADECEFFTQEETLCEKRPTAISLRYTGGDCSHTSHNQDPGKVSCADFSPLVEPVWIVISKPDGSNVSLDTGGAVVQFGDIVTATAENAGRSDFDSESLVQVFDENNVLLQEIVFHTSCSQPLAPGDQFGSVEVVGFENADQGQVQLGVEVEYTYEIKNIGDVEVFNLTVEDDILGTVPGSPIESLGPDETTTLTATAFVEETTTNTVTVTGETMFGDKCSAMDWSTVTAVGPPPCTVSSVEFKISDDKIEWKLSNDGDELVTIDSIEIRWPEALGYLKKVKREKDTIFEGPVPPSSALITSHMMTSDLKKRQIKPGESKKVKFEFAAKAFTVPEDYEITVNFAENCSVTFEPGSIPFVCSDAKPIDSLTMIWGGSNNIESIDVYRDKYDPKDPMKHLMYTIAGPISADDEVTADGYAAVDAKNDVDWVITFSDGTGGISRFHRSCSDEDMNGPEDCGKAEGNSKDDNNGFINDWIFEGMAGNGLSLDCTP